VSFGRSYFSAASWNWNNPLVPHGCFSRYEYYLEELLSCNFATGFVSIQFSHYATNYSLYHTTLVLQQISSQLQRPPDQRAKMSSLEGWKANHNLCKLKGKVLKNPTEVSRNNWNLQFSLLFVFFKPGHALNLVV
jgi:hypothetical protein